MGDAPTRNGVFGAYMLPHLKRNPRVSGIRIAIMQASTLSFPKGPCAQRVYTLALTYLYRDYSKAEVYTIWAHGPLGSSVAGLDSKPEALNLCRTWRGSMS